jgi:hypothetical protein
LYGSFEVQSKSGIFDLLNLFFFGGMRGLKRKRSTGDIEDLCNEGTQDTEQGQEVVIHPRANYHSFTEVSVIVTVWGCNELWLCSSFI